MDEQSKVNAIVNVGQLKVVEKVYDDVLSNPGQKMGNALGTVVDTVNTVLWPVKWANERVKIFFENNLRKYKERLESIPQEKITPVPPEIAVPILERFTYLSNEELCNAFVNLLTSASSTDTVGNSHPGFIHILDRLSPDEAKILMYLDNGHHVIPSVEIILVSDNITDFRLPAIRKSTGLEDNLELTFPSNMKLYIENLLSLGLIDFLVDYSLGLTEEYDRIEKKIMSIYALKNLTEDLKLRYEVNKHSYITTDLCKLFLKACIKNND